MAKAKNDKGAAQAVMDVVKMDKEKYRHWDTKVLGLELPERWRSSVRTRLDPSWLQSGARGKASRMQFKKLQDQKLALYACQRAIHA